MLWAIGIIGGVGVLWGLIAQIRIGGLNTKIARLDGALVDA
ncbi:hypothetical protein LCGC14_1271250, partial [marine sediment metagenome]